ncbi:hypothetical protein Mboo_0508 [Methanoregula boonei 6A8]|jgi:hypothetical protein|uniref:Uncharacterized protein n=1 Tax=Methanoregula boonei (strain DSM 21154 / JCM 14090 / 6A8) TaxID=456442 RepID=A7I5L5_METB6|nr:hypothetical protein [Methanoregula boonei]ABS55026.1 hypothetical protein Mboo_0508 [Methanoregula boonei 6A8]
MVESLPASPTTSPKDMEGDEKGALKSGKRGLSLSQCIVEVLRAEPERAYVIRDLVEQTGGCYNSVKRTLLRLSSSRKGSGPVRKVGHGLYQYDPCKEQDSLQALVRSGNWKIENLTFVSLGAQGGAVSLSEIALGQTKGTPPDLSQPTPHPNVPFPWKTETGHLVTWDDYQNGTQVIRISANGAPPISPDAAILLIGNLKNFGMDNTWICKSLELNIDSYRHRIDSSYSLQFIEGLLLKAYQHGYYTRVEIADRREVPLREVTELFHALAGGLVGLEALKEIQGMKERLTRCEKKTDLAYTKAAKVWDGKQQTSTTTGTKKAKSAPVSSFRTGTEIKQEQGPAPATASGAIQ